MKETVVGILSTGIYLPDKKMTAEEISQATKGHWTKEAVINKLGIVEKRIPDEEDGTQAMGVKAAKKAIENAAIDPKEIDLILSIGEEWKEYPLTTSSIYIQGQIGAVNAWGIDIQQRCCTTVSAMKIAKDMMLGNSDINVVLIAGGYRNGDLVDYTDANASMLYNLGAGGGALILKKNYRKNVLLGSSIMSDGSMSRDAGVAIGGTAEPINRDNLNEAYKSLTLFRPKAMKERLNDVSLKNWMTCIHDAFQKSNLSVKSLDYLAVLHFKKSMHDFMLNELGLNEDQSIYLSEFGHIGQIDQILSIHLAKESGLIKNGSIVSMIAAGIGYAWAANVIQWGDYNDNA